MRTHTPQPSPGLQIIFDTDGQGCCLYAETIDLSCLGRLQVERASTIEFDEHAQYWRVRDSDGFAMFNSRSRTECLDWERQHFESRERMRHERTCPAGTPPTRGTPDGDNRAFLGRLTGTIRFGPGWQEPVWLDSDVKDQEGTHNT